MNAQKRPTATATGPLVSFPVRGCGQAGGVAAGGAMCLQTTIRVVDQIKSALRQHAEANGSKIDIGIIMEIFDDCLEGPGINALCGEAERRCDTARRAERAAVGDRRGNFLLRSIVLPFESAFDAELVDRDVIGRLSSALGTIIGPRSIFTANNGLRALSDGLPIPDRRTGAAAGDASLERDARWLELMRHPDARIIIERILVRLADHYRNDPQVAIQLDAVFGGKGKDTALLTYLLFAPLFHRKWSAEEIREFQYRHKVTPKNLGAAVFGSMTGDDNGDAALDRLRVRAISLGVTVVDADGGAE